MYKFIDCVLLVNCFLFKKLNDLKVNVIINIIDLIYVFNFIDKNYIDLNENEN